DGRAVGPARGSRPRPPDRDLRPRARAGDPSGRGLRGQRIWGPARWRGDPPTLPLLAPGPRVTDRPARVKIAGRQHPRPARAGPGRTTTSMLWIPLIWICQNFEDPSPRRGSPIRG